MKILVTGAKGFVGKNLVCALENIKANKDRTRPNILIDEVYSYDIDSSKDELDLYCKNADFVFHLAGVNRPKETKEFYEGNGGLTEKIVAYLKENNKNTPILITS